MKNLCELRLEIEAGQMAIRYDGRARVWKGYDDQILLETRHGGILGFDSVDAMLRSFGAGYVGPLWTLATQQKG